MKIRYNKHENKMHLYYIILQYIIYFIIYIFIISNIFYNLYIYVYNLCV